MPFSIGDVVHLIAYHSHRMTVVDVDGHEITCRWFEGAAVKECIFSSHMITKVAQPEAVEATA